MAAAVIDTCVLLVLLLQLSFRDLLLHALHLCQEERAEEPSLLLIYYVNDYIAHWLAIVWLIDLIKLGLITAGDI